MAPDETVFTGEVAWQRASMEPGRFVAAPLLLTGDTAVVAGVEVAVLDLVAAVLRRVAVEAARVVGGPVGEVRLVVPAGWGPRRRTWLRQAAYRAGLGQPVLVEAPVAVAGQLVAGGARVLVGQFLLVCDFGGGFEATVLRGGPQGFEVLSTLYDADAGGSRLDELLLARLRRADPGLPELSEPGGWGVFVAVRSGREMLSRQSVVTVFPPEPWPAMVVSGGVLESIAGPVLRRAGEVAGAALSAAEVEPGQVAGVFCVGGGAVMPDAVQAVAEGTGLAPVAVEEPGLAAVVGAAMAGSPGPGPSAAGVGNAGGAPVDGVGLPSLRRVVGAAIPVFMSLVVLAHFVTTAELQNGTRLSKSPLTYLLANWGELAVAAVAAVVGCLSFGAVLASVLAVSGPPTRLVGVRVGTGLVAAAVAGVSVAGLYGVGAALFFGMPLEPFLRWSLWPVVPITAVAVIGSLIAARSGRTPVSGWHGWLAFPPGSVVAAAVGMMLVQYAMTTGGTADTALLLEAAARGGGLLLGLGMALAVVSGWLARLMVAPLLALFCAIVVSVQATGVMAVMYVVAVTVWWLRRLWQLVRSPAQADQHAW
ncbi:Hsp70 family protein [Polymorphospora sp. NPDC051019]|uniref:Hsp70 family protein n=1 Tax=Polymorphospora sp. NPDC051019 TaxID=3155725 RepID=UPI00343341A7